MVSATNSNNLKLKEVENLASDGKMAEAYSLIVGLVVKNTVRHTLFGAQFLPNSVWNWLENGAAALAMNAWRGKSPKEPEQSGTDAATDKAAAPQGLTGPPELDFYTKRMLDLIGIATGWAELWEFLQNIFCVAGFLAAVLAAYMFLLYPAVPQAWGGGKYSCVKIILAEDKVPLENTPPVLTFEGSDEGKPRITQPVKLLYVTKDAYYMRQNDGPVIQLTSDAVSGVVYIADHR